MPHAMSWRAFALVLPFLLAGRAQAHAILMDGTPAAHAAVPPGPLAVRLRYNSRIDRARSRLLLVRPDRSQAVLAIAPDGPPDVLAGTAAVAPGEYTLRWQVLAVDGHITRGDVPFTVQAAPGTVQAAPGTVQAAPGTVQAAPGTVQAAPGPVAGK